MRRLIRGFKSHTDGLRLIQKHRPLLLLSIAPATLQALLFILGVYLATAHLGDIITPLFSWLPEGYLLADEDSWYYLILSKVVLLARWILKAIVTLLALILLFAALFLVGTLLASPLYDLLSEKTEALLGNQDEQPFNLDKFLKTIKVTLKVELQKILLLVIVPILCFFIGLIPVVGVVISLVVVHVYACLAFAFTFVDYPMARRDWSLGERLRFCRQHTMELLGMGLVFFIPAINFLGAPLFVVSGTLLFTDLKKRDATLER